MTRSWCSRCQHETKDSFTTTGPSSMGRYLRKRRCADCKAFKSSAAGTYQDLARDRGPTRSRPRTGRMSVSGRGLASRSRGPAPTPAQLRRLFIRHMEPFSLYSDNYEEEMAHMRAWASGTVQDPFLDEQFEAFVHENFE